VTYSLHLVDDGFFFAKKLYHPDLSGSTRFFIFLGGGSRVAFAVVHGLMRRFQPVMLDLEGGENGIGRLFMQIFPR
jgi:hypothetical protein